MPMLYLQLLFTSLFATFKFVFLALNYQNGNNLYCCRSINWFYRWYLLIKVKTKSEENNLSDLRNEYEKLQAQLEEKIKYLQTEKDV